jgi:cytochrome oxidase assembly protein ShyY1
MWVDVVAVATKSPHVGAAHTGGVRFLLRPGWIAFTFAVAVFAFACYYLLAPWQFHRSTERDASNQALVTALATAPVPRTDLVAPGQAPGPGVEWRQVVVAGTYDPAGEVLVRLRSVDGGAAYEVMTPLRTDRGDTVLVDRGYVRPLGGAAVPPIAPPPAGPVSVVGYLHADEEGTDRAAIVSGGYRQVYAADARLVTAATGQELSPGYVQLLPAQPGVLTPVPLPQPDTNSSYSYAWQWLIFGVMAIGAWVYFVRLEYRTRRGLAGTSDDARGTSDPRDAPDGTPAPAARPRTTDEVLADRYGKR